MTAPTGVMPADLAQHRDRCKSCRSRIIRARTSDDQAIPVDEATNPTAGNVALVRQGGALIAIVLTRGKAMHARTTGAFGPLRTSHFDTCPQAHQHRKRR